MEDDVGVKLAKNSMVSDLAESLQDGWGWCATLYCQNVILGDDMFSLVQCGQWMDGWMDEVDVQLTRVEVIREDSKKVV